MQGDENDPLGPLRPTIHQGRRKDTAGTSAKRINAARRRILAMQLRMEGMEFKEIGQRLGCSTQRAHGIVKQEFARLRMEQNELAEDMLKLTKDRLERLISTYWKKATDGDKLAAEMVVKLIDRQARLFGFNAPEKTESRIEVAGSDPERLKALARMQGLDTQDLENDDGETKSPAPEGELPPSPKDCEGRSNAGANPSD